VDIEHWLVNAMVVVYIRVPVMGRARQIAVNRKERPPWPFTPPQWRSFRFHMSPLPSVGATSAGVWASSARGEHRHDGDAKGQQLIATVGGMV